MQSGELFKEIRKILKMSQSKFAEELGLGSASSICEIEKGKDPIPKKYFKIMRDKKLGNAEKLDELARLAESERIEKDHEQYSQHTNNAANRKKTDLDQLEEKIDVFYELFKKGDPLIISEISSLCGQLKLIIPETPGEIEKTNQLQAEIGIFQAEIDLLASRSKLTQELLYYHTNNIQHLQPALKAEPEKFEYSTELLTSLNYIFGQIELAYLERQARLKEGNVLTSRARAICLRDGIGYPADAFSQNMLRREDAFNIFVENMEFAIYDMKVRDYNPMDCAYVLGCIAESAEKFGGVYYMDYLNEAWSSYHLAEANGVYDIKIGARLLLIEAGIFLRKPDIDVKGVIENVDPVINFFTDTMCERYRDTTIHSLLNKNDKQIRQLGNHYLSQIPLNGIRYLPKSFLL